MMRQNYGNNYKALLYSQVIVITFPVSVSRPSSSGEVIIPESNRKERDLQKGIVIGEGQRQESVYGRIDGGNTCERAKERGRGKGSDS